MTLGNYQRIMATYDNGTDQLTQVAWLICDIYEKSYDEVNNMKPKEFIRYSKKVTRVLNKVLKPRLFSRLKFQTNAERITLGQFIEVQHFIQMGEFDGMHLIGASILKSKKDHKQRAEMLQESNVRDSLVYIKLFMESLAKLMESYKGLFETEETEEEEKTDTPHPFIAQYGWIYSAKKVAEHEGMKLDEAFNLPILQAFNDLAYLKSYGEYQRKINE